MSYASRSNQSAAFQTGISDGSTGSSSERLTLSRSRAARGIE